MNIPANFDQLRAQTQPSQQQRDAMVTAHQGLRNALHEDTSLRGHVLTTLIQGSHRRKTALRGTSTHPCDVDIIVVTTLSRSTASARRGNELLQPFLSRRYPSACSQRDRAWRIIVNTEVRLDLVAMARPESAGVENALASGSIRDWAPSDDSWGSLLPGSAGFDWNRADPLWIPDRALNQWEQTHPLLVLDWTSQKNDRCNGHFAGVVRAIKWWWRRTQPQPQHLKGYPIEHIVGECCPNSISNPAEGIAAALETIAARFRDEGAHGRIPHLPARGVPAVNVLRRVEPQEFSNFVRQAATAAATARAALNSYTSQESVELWARLLGDAVR